MGRLSKLFKSQRPDIASRTIEYWNYCKSRRGDPNFWLSLLDEAGVCEIIVEGPEGRKLSLLPDNGVGLKYLITGNYDPTILNFFSMDFAERSLENFVVVDVGANVGLFSNQMLSEFGHRIDRLYGYEPDDKVAELARRNVDFWANKVTMKIAGLGATTRDVVLYVDRKHPSSSSFDQSALPGEHYTTEHTPAQMLSASVEAASWMSHGSKILYKSDTQGFDEEIFLAYDSHTLSQFTAGLIEIFPKPRTVTEIDRLANALQLFDRLYVMDRQGIISGAQIDSICEALRKAESFDIGFRSSVNV